MSSKTKPAATTLLSQRDEHILQVATELFSQRGFASCDVQEIADRLEIGKGTIYRAFGTKEELFCATVDYGMRQLSERLFKSSSENCGRPQALEEWLLTFFAFFEEHPELVELLMQERSLFRHRDSHSYIRHWLSNSPSWRARIEEGMTAGRFRALDPDRLIDALSALCYGTIFISFFSNKKINLEATAKFLTEIVQCGVLSDEERANRAQGRH